MIIRGGTFGPVATNTYVVADRQGGSAIVVDPALGSRAWVADTLTRMGATPVAVLDTHGHWDHVVAEDEGEALVGDLIFAQGIGRTDFPRSDHAAMMRSLDRLLREVPGATRIYPGHGPWGVTLAEAEPYARMFM